MNLSKKTDYFLLTKKNKEKLNVKKITDIHKARLVAFKLVSNGCSKCFKLLR